VVKNAPVSIAHPVQKNPRFTIRAPIKFSPCTDCHFTMRTWQDFISYFHAKDRQKWVETKKTFDDLRSVLKQLQTLVAEPGADLEEMEEEGPKQARQFC
jgi:hypothetical protein